jgi:predicted HTH domain antitoxin
MASVNIDIPDDLIEGFKNLEQVRRTVLEDFIIEQRQSGKLSLGRAAELLELTYGEFFDLLGRKGLSFVNATTLQREEGQRHLEEALERKDP